MPLAAKIASVAHYVPERRVTNDDLAQCMDTSDAWITERTGIKERRFIEHDGVTTSVLGEHAARRALEGAGWRPDQLDLIVVATLSPDFYFPGVGVLLQQRLGCRTIPALDIRAQCSGLVYGLSCIDGYIKSRQAKRVLLVCAEVQSPVLDLTTRGREMAVLFGDGAGAVCIESVEVAKEGEIGIIDSYLGSDGSGAEVLCMKLPGTATPGFIRASDIQQGLVHPQMEGKVVFKNAVTRLLETAHALLRRNGLQSSDLGLVIPHQANLRINEMVREQLGLPVERVFNNIQRYGNTTAATIPICMSEAVAQGALKSGDLVMTLAFGAGFTWGGNIIRW
ncbi:MAG: beta-ketoacyl-ACP synthase III [Pseudomonadota bacterium]|jgi:3-oxoacyl-[acyl-carrier-protein] synthase-3